MYASTINLNNVTKLCLRILLVATEQGKSLKDFLEQPYVKNALSPMPLDSKKKFVGDYESVCNLPMNIAAESKEFLLAAASFASIGLHVLKKSTFFDGIKDLGAFSKVSPTELTSYFKLNAE